MASTIDDSLLSHVVYEWTNLLTFPSISKDLWDKLKTLFGTTGFAAVFHLFKQVVENPGISYSDILILIPDSRMVYDLIFTLFILLTLSR